MQIKAATLGDRPLTDPEVKGEIYKEINRILNTDGTGLYIKFPLTEGAVAVQLELTPEAIATNTLDEHSLQFKVVSLHNKQVIDRITGINLTSATTFKTTFSKNDSKSRKLDNKVRKLSPNNIGVFIPATSTITNIDTLLDKLEMPVQEDIFKNMSISTKIKDGATKEAIIEQVQGSNPVDPNKPKPPKKTPPLQ